MTEHDHAELYVIDVSADGGEPKHVATVPAPIAGQGIVWDHGDPGILLGNRSQQPRSRLRAGIKHSMKTTSYRAVGASFAVMVQQFLAEWSELLSG